MSASDIVARCEALYNDLDLGYVKELSLIHI